VGKGTAILCLLAGGIVCAAGLGLLPKNYMIADAPPRLLAAGGIILAVLGFMALARDHRVSETITSLLLIAVAAGAGWLTFIAPPGTVNEYIPFIPASVNESLARLLFGLGAVACVGLALIGLRRILR
jgi:hypothetical protein